MSVYNDMANDAGYRYGSDENMQMAQMIEEDERVHEREEYHRHMEEQYYYYIIGMTNFINDNFTTA